MILTESQLKETYSRTKKSSGLDPRTKPGFKRTLADPRIFNEYVTGLSEGLSEKDALNFKILAASTRRSLMENSMFQLNPYETLMLPILRVYYPRLISKELVNVMPIDKPDVVKGFLNASFKIAGETAYDDTSYDFPSVSTDISRGKPVSVTATATTSLATEDVLAKVNLNPDLSHLEKNFKITAVNDGTATFTVEVIPDVDGNFSESLTLSGGQTDVLHGNVNWHDGTFTWSSANGYVSSVTYYGICSTEENLINPTVTLSIDKIRLTTIRRTISAEWSIDIEQDIRALYDINLQSQLVNIMGEQIAIDIDREIINDLISQNNSQNAATHRETFDINPPATFDWGEKLWYENVIPVLNRLSAQIHTDTYMGAANVIACNPIDAAVFESINTFNYAGSSTEGGDLGYAKATVAGGKWKILSSSIVPQGTSIVKYKSDIDTKASYVYAPYVPALLSPYPLGNKPSMSIISRYATKMVRPKAVGTLSFTNSAS